MLHKKENGFAQNARHKSRWLIFTVSSRKC